MAKHVIDKNAEWLKERTLPRRFCAFWAVGHRAKRIDCTTQWSGATQTEVLYHVVAGSGRREKTYLSTPDLAAAVERFNEL